MVSMSTATTLVSTTDTIKTSILLPVMVSGLNVEKQSVPSKPPDNTSVQPSEGKVLPENLTDTYEKSLADLLGEPVGLSFDSDSDEEIEPDDNTSSTCIADLFMEPVGLSFDESDQNQSEESSDSSDFQVADCDTSRRVMLAIDPNAPSGVIDKPDEYTFREDEKAGENRGFKKSKSFGIKKEACCNNFCRSQNFNVQFLNKMETLHGMSKAERKQFLLEHLIKQEELGVSTQSFKFFGYCVCKKSLVHLSGVSNYIIEEACKAYERGQTRFRHNNEVGMRETEATLGFVIWMKRHALQYGNQAPDHETIIIPACYMKKDLFQQYEEEVTEPRIKRSTFYRLFSDRFGPYRVDKSVPHVRISSYSSHSKCEQCISLERYQKTCKKEQDLELVKSMKQRHKYTYQKSYEAIQEKRFEALSDPENYLHIQGTASYFKYHIIEVSYLFIQIFKCINGFNLLNWRVPDTSIPRRVIQFLR